MLPISLSPSSPEPFYQQIVDQIRSLILSGRLEPGTLLPSVRVLAAELAVSVITTRRAYQELEREGVIVTRPGLGSLVADRRPEALEQARLDQVRARLEEAVNEAQRLGVAPDQVVRLLLSLVDGRPGTRLPERGSDSPRAGGAPRRAGEDV